MRWAIAAAGAVVLVIGVALLAVTPDLEDLPPGGRAIPYLGVVLAWGFTGVGGFAWARRPDNRTGKLMTAVGFTMAISALQLFDSALLFAVGALCDTLAVSVVIHLLLAFPSGRLETRAERIAAALGYTAGALQIPLVLFTDCRDDGCPGNPLLISDQQALADAVSSLQAFMLGVAAAIALFTVIRRWRASNPAERRGLEPVLALGVVIIVLGIATAASQAFGARQPIQIAFITAFALLPAAFLAGLVRTRFFRTATVTRLIERLARDPRGVRDALAVALADPTLEVAYWLGDGYVTADGRPLEAPGRQLTAIDHEGKRVGAIIHAGNLPPELLDDAAAAAALALENARLEVELRARLEALRASRARLVEAGDAERRRLGRDLHDGAQQRLVALMIELQLARERFDADPDTARALVDSAFANAQAAVGELRDLAAGIHPAVLSQRGLDAAIESLASRSPVPVEIDEHPPERFPSAVETAAYFVVAEALTNIAKYAGATYAAVAVRRENGHAVIDVRDDGKGGADASAGSGLRGLADRVGALDGTLEVTSPPGAGTLIRARFPL